MDASFDAYGSGGWGEDADRSMVSTQKKADFDKVPIPVLISDLCRLSQGEENYVIGSHKFTTIRVCARVLRTLEIDNGNQVNYDVTDPTDEEGRNVFKIVHYQGVETKQGDQNDAFPEDSIVHAVGRLRSFDGHLNLVTFQIRPVEQEPEIEAFQLETKLAKIYYGVKNVPECLISGRMDAFRGTLFSAEAPDRTKTASTAAGAQQGRPTYGQQGGGMGPPNAKRLQQSNENNTGLTGQKKKIFEAIKASQDESGMSIDSMKRTLRNVTPRFEQDLAELVDDGMLYQTLDDQHYAAV